VLVLPAELTHAGASACCRMLAQALRTDASAHAVADASALRVFDSSALAVLLECRREALALGKSFAVAHMPPELKDLVDLYGLAELLPRAA
jgi:phospholipid transport system transporter-binding protein